MSARFTQKLRAWLGIELAPVSHAERLASVAGGFVGILAVYLTGRLFVGEVGAAMLAASMGSSAVLLFAVPHGPLSQPWPVIGGHFVSALIGVTCAKFIPEQAIAAALAVGLSNGAMHYLRCIHPPGGATALVAVIGGAQVHELGYAFVVTPVMMNVAVIIAAAIAFNYPLAWRRYPAALKPKKPEAPVLEATEPAINHADLVFALTEIGSFIDVSEHDLLRIYDIATHRHPREQPPASSIHLGRYYSNGKYGEEWEIRRVIDQSHDAGQDADSINYRVVAGTQRRRTGVTTRSDFARWAAYEVQLNENSWQRIDDGE